MALYTVLFSTRGADVDASDQDSCTPLLIAAEFGKKEAFECLLSRHAAIDDVDKDRKSCVFLAAEHNHIHILQVL